MKALPHGRTNPAADARLPATDAEAWHRDRYDPRPCVVELLAAVCAADDLPMQGDLMAAFHPGVAFVRRVRGNNLWVWYRLDGPHVAFLKITDQPPVPADSE